jgi:ATP-dependent DNA helicase DinG
MENKNESKNILDFFPLKDREPRDIQKQALEWLAEQKARYLLLEAPTGNGKSAIGLCLSAYLSSNGKGSSFVLTPQKILQDQYNREQERLKIPLTALYGKGNYECREKGTTCDIGSAVKPKCEACPFSTALATAITCPNTVLNYKLGLLLFKYTNVFDRHRRNLMILDECHTVEKHLVDFGLVTVTQHRCDKYKLEFPDVTKLNLFTAHEWLRNVFVPRASKYLELLSIEVEPLLDANGDELSRSDLKKIREYINLEDYLENMKEFMFVKREDLMDEYVLVHDRKTISFKQLTGARNFHDIVKPYADRFLFMSSTILNKEGFCKDLGLPPDETAFLSVDSEFPPDNRPVLYFPQMKMNAEWKIPENAPGRKKMVDYVAKLLDFHKEESGIIHTANFAISAFLTRELGNLPEVKHRILNHNPDGGDERGSVIHLFQQNKKPSVLISPSITEGLDLYDDLSRFAIFAKVPFGYLGDQWIKRRLEWYQRQALIDIIQGGGRIVRSKEDWGVVYILDQSWAYLYSQTFSMLPKWWLKAYNRT